MKTLKELIEKNGESLRFCVCSPIDDNLTSAQRDQGGCTVEELDSYLNNLLSKYSENELDINCYIVDNDRYSTTYGEHIGDCAFFVGADGDIKKLLEQISNL